jgi:F-type H+-transporting ATPase subunit a
VLRKWFFFSVLFLLVTTVSGVGAALLWGMQAGAANLIVGTLLIDALIIVLAVIAVRGILARKANARIPRGWQNVIEWFLENPADSKIPTETESVMEEVQDQVTEDLKSPKKSSAWLRVIGKWLIIGVLFLSVACGLLMLSSGFLAKLGIPTLLDGILGEPAMPTINLPAERVFGSVNIFGFETGLTNTLIATLIADVLLVGLAFLATRKIRAGSADAWVPRGLQNAFEWIIETLYNMGELVLGTHIKKVFWLGATIFLFILFANWMEMVPGIDAIGWIERPAEANVDTFHKGTFLGVDTIKGPAIPPVSVDAPKFAEAAPAEPSSGDARTMATGFILVPFVRAATTDLNLTIALAVITMVMVQFYGFRSMGIGYLGKFVAVQRLLKGKWMGLLDAFVGALESISEVSKIVSFAFRLFGNVFAGQVLLFVMGFLIPFLVFGNMIFWGLEVFVGVIQAFVFMMLTFVFVAQATAGHGDHSETAASH